MTTTLLSHAYAVILAGGEGTRFWPVSRKGNPKQFLALAGGETMLQATVARIAPLVPIERTIIVTADAHAGLVREQLPDFPPENLLGEPAGRNTAAAVAWAAEVVRERDADGIMVVLAADHHILNPDTFRAAVSRAVSAAQDHPALVLYGLTPEGPKTQYGYIIPRTGPAPGSDRDAAHLPGQPPVYEVARFHEKPDEATARRYLGSGRCFWNSGMFTWRADVVLDELGRNAPEVLSAVRSALAVRSDREEFASAYARIPSISVDHALVERSEHRLVVESGIERVDLGTWATISAVWPSDSDGNVSVGDVVVLDTKNTIHHTSGKLVVTIGLENMVVVATGDVVLICDRSRAAEVNELVKRLQQTNATEWL
jgi:mannose-1-phosphate guanylyltransferase